MITKQSQAQLLEALRKPNVRLEYTMEGPLHAKVISCQDSEIHHQFLKGERTFQKALDEFRHEQSLRSHEGLSKAQFNHKGNIEP